MHGEPPDHVLAFATGLNAEAPCGHGVSYACSDLGLYLNVSEYAIVKLNVAHSIACHFKLDL